VGTLDANNYRNCVPVQELRSLESSGILTIDNAITFEAESAAVAGENAIFVW